MREKIWRDEKGKEEGKGREGRRQVAIEEGERVKKGRGREGS